MQKKSTLSYSMVPSGGFKQCLIFLYTSHMVYMNHHHMQVSLHLYKDKKIVQDEENEPIISITSFLLDRQIP